MACSCSQCCYWLLPDWARNSRYPGQVNSKYTVDFLSAVAFYGVNLIAQSIIYTWSYNSTGGSVLMLIFLHGSLNWSTWFLSMNDIPSVGIMPLILFMIIEVVVAIIIVVVSGKDLNWAHVKSGC